MYSAISFLGGFSIFLFFAFAFFAYLGGEGEGVGVFFLLWLVDLIPGVGGVLCAIAIVAFLIWGDYTFKMGAGAFLGFVLADVLVTVLVMAPYITSFSLFGFGF